MPVNVVNSAQLHHATGHDPESFLNELSLISRASRIGSMFSGLSASLNFTTALCRCSYVALQRGQVPPELTSRCQTMGNCLIPAFSLFAGLSQPHFSTVSVAVFGLSGAAVISTALVVPPQHEFDMIRAPFSELHIHWLIYTD
jgi:hypothetical protein